MGEICPGIKISYNFQLEQNLRSETAHYWIAEVVGKVVEIKLTEKPRIILKQASNLAVVLSALDDKVKQHPYVDWNL